MQLTVVRYLYPEDDWPAVCDDLRRQFSPEIAYTVLLADSRGGHVLVTVVVEPTLTWSDEAGLFYALVRWGIV